MSVAIIGAGPRGISVLERLLSRISQRPSTAVTIHLIDPFEPGPGRVWQVEQSPLYLMNTPAYFPTAVPADGGYNGTASFAQWRTEALPDMHDTAYPTRAQYGAYLRATYAQLTAALPDGVQVLWHRALAESVRPLTKQPTKQPGYSVSLGSAGPSLVVDAVVLALGHVPAQLTQEQQTFQVAAASNGLQYYPPAVPVDVTWDAVPDGDAVLIRGLGLNFFDIFAQLTVGRGGRFTETEGAAGAALKYHPSGREPHLLITSRRGVPYRAKSQIDQYYAPAAHIAWLQRFLDETGGEVSFAEDVRPQIERDVATAYYRTLVMNERSPRSLAVAEALPRLEPAWVKVEQAFGNPAEFAAALGSFEALLPEAERFNLAALSWPLEGQDFSTSDELTAAILQHLDADYAAALRGEADPWKMVVAVLNRSRAVVKDLVNDGRFDEASWPGQIRSSFEPLVELLASGPPAHRIAELAAAVRAGVVEFVGPEPEVRVTDEGFAMRSPRVHDDAARARTLIEAMVPGNHLARTDSALIRQLLDDGLARARWPEERGKGSGFDVAPGSLEALNGAGEPSVGLYVLGLQLSSWRWGTAIAAEASPEYASGTQALRDADAIAAHILG